MQAVIFDLDETIFAGDVILREDTAALLRILRRLGVKIGALTSADHRMLVRLDEAGIRNHFDGIVCTAHVTNPKDIDGVHHLLRNLDSAASATALVSNIGDDMTLGKQSGLAKTIHVTQSQPRSTARHLDADHTVPDIAAILDVLE